MRRKLPMVEAPIGTDPLAYRIRQIGAEIESDIDGIRAEAASTAPWVGIVKEIEKRCCYIRRGIAEIKTLRWVADHPRIQVLPPKERTDA